MNQYINNDSNQLNDIDFSKKDGNKTYCIAWFKLADLISRKEKEKALNLYKLISYSLNDKAYALQVEGDILWTMQDEMALEKYSQAAFLYKKEKKLISAVAIYEHLLVLEPKNFDYNKTLVLLYIFLSWPEKFEENYSKLLLFLDDNQSKQNEILYFTKQLINFFINPKNINTNKFKEEYDIEFDLDLKNPWLLKSLIKILQNQNTILYKYFKKYCLDNKFDLNS